MIDKQSISNVKPSVKLKQVVSPSVKLAPYYLECVRFQPTGLISDGRYQAVHPVEILFAM
ncbi:MAG: hypothetical protein ABIJ65_01060 [Chloroflexota bacterium]